MLRYKLILLLSFIFVAATAQVPGYLGKKNIVLLGARASVIPAIAFVADPIDEASTLNKRALFWNLGLKRAVGRSSMLGLTGTYSQDRVYGPKQLDRIPSLFSGFDVALDFRSYYYALKGNIAPLGRHFRCSAMYSNYLLNTIENKIPVGQVMFLGLGVGFGNSRVFYDKIWVDYGWEFNWIINVYDQQDMVKGWDYTKQTQNIVQNAYGVSFNLAVGYLY